MRYQRPDVSDFNVITVIDEKSMRKDIVQRQYAGFTPLTRFDEAFLIIRHRLGLKVNPELLVEIENPRPASALDDERLHQDGGDALKGISRGGRDASFTFEGGRKFHRFGPVLLADVGAAS